MIDFLVPDVFARSKGKNSIEIILLNAQDWKAFEKKLNQAESEQLALQKFTGKVGDIALQTSGLGKLRIVYAIIHENPGFYALAPLADFLSARLSKTMLEKSTFILRTTLAKKSLPSLYAGWGVAAYRFTAFKKRSSVYPKLFLPASVNRKYVDAFVYALCATRTLINTPANHLGSSQLVKAAKQIANPFKARVHVTQGDTLQKNFPLVYAVGAAAEQPPCLIDIQWGNKKHKKLTLVGKGVTFDTGGLNIKPEQGMLMMKKDMGGAAHVLGLAHLIMALKLPVSLRVIIPVAENSISDESFRPGDVLISRKGLSVEITNTDAEGRLILADALDLAVSENPDLVIDFATLTGAARVALGTDIPALFSNKDKTARDLQNISISQYDPLWHLPLWAEYQKDMDSAVADMRNSGSGFAGAITAGLFLKRFVPDGVDWVHIDTYAWENLGRPGRAAGGMDLGLRSVFAYLESRYT